VVWDNSASNPHNPTSPPALVTWGEQSRDEMGSVTLDLVPHLQVERKALADALSEHSNQIRDAAYARDPGLKDYADDLANGRTKVFQNGGTKEQK